MDFKNYFEELKRRKVFKAAVAYLAVAWVLIEVASAVLPAFDTPPFVLKALIIILILGFPVNLIFSWVYDVTPEGLRKTDTLPNPDSLSHVKGKRLNRVIIGFLSVAVVILLYNQFVRTKTDEAIKTNPLEITDDTIKTIAVLPFEDISPEKDQEWLAAGLVDAINNNLVNINGLRVIASRSVSQLVKDNTNTERMVEELGLTHILEGSVLRYGDKIRINVDLVATEDQSQMLSRSFEQDIASVYDILDEVATVVGRELEFEFNVSKVRIPDAERTSSTVAYNLFLKARHESTEQWGQWPPIIREYLEKAIELDSTFYAAYTTLGMYWSSQYTWDGESSANFKDNIQKSNELFEFAIRNAPSYGNSHLRLAMNKIFYEQDFSAYSQALEGYELNPSTTNKLYLINTALSALGEDPQWAYELALEAMNESPVEPGSWAAKGLSEYFIGYHEEALKTLEQGLNKFSEGNLYSTAGRIFYALRNYEKVVEVFEEYTKAYPDKRPPRNLGYLAAAHYKLGHLTEYESLMEELRNRVTASSLGSPAFHLAMVSAQTGDHEAAFQWLNKAIEDKEVELYWLKVEPPFEPLYNDPRWEELMDEMGFNDVPKTS